MGANMFELMVVIVLAILLNSQQFTNFMLERSRGIGTVDVRTMSYYGGKIAEICHDTEGRCDGIYGETTLPAGSPAIPSTMTAANAYWYASESVNEPLTQSPFTLVWAPSVSSNAFALNDPEPFIA